MKQQTQHKALYNSTTYSLSTLKPLPWNGFSKESLKPNNQQSHAIEALFIRKQTLIVLGQNAKPNSNSEFPFYHNNNNNNNKLQEDIDKNKNHINV